LHSVAKLNQIMYIDAFRSRGVQRYRRLI